MKKYFTVLSVLLLVGTGSFILVEAQNKCPLWKNPCGTPFEGPEQQPVQDKSVYTGPSHIGYRTGSAELFSNLTDVQECTFWKKMSTSEREGLAWVYPQGVPADCPPYPTRDQIWKGVRDHAAGEAIYGYPPFLQGPNGTTAGTSNPERTKASGRTS